jgi:hypothetical protein
VALRGSKQQQQQPQAPQVPTGSRTLTEKKSLPAPEEPKKSGQSFRAQNVNSQPLDNMLQVVTIVEQIMTKLSGAVSEEENIVAFTKIVLNLMKQSGH